MFKIDVTTSTLIDSKDIINEQETIELFFKHMPSMLDELQGLADALDWKMEDALREFGGYYVDYEENSCSMIGCFEY